jgi:ribonuclease Z
MIIWSASHKIIHSNLIDDFILHISVTVFMSSVFKVTLLGTGYPTPRMDRFGPSTLVEAGATRLLFDSGRGTMQRINQIDPNAKTFDKLFLTHLHSDHTTGIPDLWITGTLRGRYDNPLRIWGPKRTENMMYHIQEAFKVDVKVRGELRKNSGLSLRDGTRIEVCDIDEGFIFEENGIRVIPFRVNHHDLYSDEPSLGYRFECDGRSLVISGDTCYCENLVKYSRGVDLLVHEVAAGPLGVVLEDRFRLPLSHHTLPEDCGKVFNAVNPGLAVFTHVIQFEGVSLEEIMKRTKKEYGGPVVFGEDLMQIEVGDEVRVINR